MTGAPLGPRASSPELETAAPLPERDRRAPRRGPAGAADRPAGSRGRRQRPDGVHDPAPARGPDRRIGDLTRSRGGTHHCSSLGPRRCPSARPHPSPWPRWPRRRRRPAPPRKLLRSSARRARRETMHLNYGPLKIKPGQNLISVDLPEAAPRSSTAGSWASGPGMVGAPRRQEARHRVGEIHLHHAVWLVDSVADVRSRRGEDVGHGPRGYGWRYTTKQYGCSTT